MICQRCGREEGEWRCSACGRIVCTDCTKTEKGKVYCLDHAPSSISKEKKEYPVGEEKGKPVKMLFYTVLILTIGLYAIVHIMERFMEGMSVPEAMPFVEILKNTGMIIVYGMAGLTILLGIGYLIARRL